MSDIPPRVIDYSNVDPLSRAFLVEPFFSDGQPSWNINPRVPWNETTEGDDEAKESKTRGRWRDCIGLTPWRQGLPRGRGGFIDLANPLPYIPNYFSFVLSRQPRLVLSSRPTFCLLHSLPHLPSISPLCLVTRVPKTYLARAPNSFYLSLALN